VRRTKKRKRRVSARIKVKSDSGNKTPAPDSHRDP